MADAKVAIVEEGHAPTASYLVDASDQLAFFQDDDCDLLDAALNAYAADGFWHNNSWQQEGNSYSLNMSGYAFLEKPREKEHTRQSHYLHAWSEPVFSLVKQEAMSEKAWWRRKTNNDGCFWGG